MGEAPENRVDRIVSDLLRGRRLRLRGGDGEEKDAITAAAQLASARHGPQRMHPAFRRRLAKDLQSTPNDAWLTRRAALVAGLGVAAGALAAGVIEKIAQPSHRAAAAPALRACHQRMAQAGARLADRHGPTGCADRSGFIRSTADVRQADQSLFGAAT